MTGRSGKRLSATQGCISLLQLSQAAGEGGLLTRLLSLDSWLRALPHRRGLMRFLPLLATFDECCRLPLRREPLCWCRASTPTARVSIGETRWASASAVSPAAGQLRISRQDLLPRNASTKPRANRKRMRSMSAIPCGRLRHALCGRSEPVIPMDFNAPAR